MYRRLFFLPTSEIIFIFNQGRNDLKATHNFRKNDTK